MDNTHDAFSGRGKEKGDTIDAQRREMFTLFEELFKTFNQWKNDDGKTRLEFLNKN